MWFLCATCFQGTFRCRNTHYMFHLFKNAGAGCQSTWGFELIFFLQREPLFTSRQLSGRNPHKSLCFWELKTIYLFVFYFYVSGLNYGGQLSTRCGRLLRTRIEQLPQNQKKRRTLGCGTAKAQLCSKNMTAVSAGWVNVQSCMAEFLWMYVCMAEFLWNHHQPIFAIIVKESSLLI